MNTNKNWLWIPMFIALGFAFILLKTSLTLSFIAFVVAIIMWLIALERRRV